MERADGKNLEVSLPFALAVMAGILIVAGASVSLAMLTWSHSMFGMGGMMGGGWQMFAAGYGQPLILTMAGISLAAGTLVLVGAYKLRSKPSEAGNWGFLILMGSIVALFCIGGFGLGSILGIVAGAIAISKR